MAAPLRVMFDSNAYDAILAHGDAEALRARIDGNRLAVITTHVQEDELRKKPDPAERKILLTLFFSLRSRRVPTSAAQWDSSKWDESGWTGQTEQDNLSAIQRNKRIVSEDEILGLTAIDHCDIVVTEDKDFKKRLAAASPNLQVMNYSSFREAILSNL